VKETTILVYRRVEETMPLYGWPDLDRIVHFDAEQRKDGGYNVEITIRYAGGPMIGIDVPHGDGLDLAITAIDEPSGEWIPVPSLDIALYPTGAGEEPAPTIFDIQRNARDFAENHFFRDDEG
jgi:hypothetical protein